ncbi:MAG: Lipoprotein signal peptidase [Chlamydiia bacterium]|nr:Lipoprotein signal peptidase [Chlamydiia bacterium]
MEQRRKLKFLFVVLFILSLDFLTKYLTHHNIAFYPLGSIPVFENFLGIKLSISHVTNRGGPWGMISSHHDVLVVLRIFAIVCLSIYLFFFNDVPFRRGPLCMIIAGALGNVIDSFVYGHVVDMIHFVFWGYSFPVFNVADASIFLGVVALLLNALYVKLVPNKDAESSHQDIL